MPISIISAINHHRRGSVNLDFLKFIFLSLLIGVIFGSIAVSFLEGSSLILIYSIILFFVALQFFFWKDEWRFADKFPNNLKGHGYGSTIGFLSVIIGVGGGSISIPILKLYNFDIRRAIGTAAGIGTIIAVPGTIGFIIAEFKIMYLYHYLWIRKFSRFNFNNAHDNYRRPFRSKICHYLPKVN